LIVHRKNERETLVKKREEILSLSEVKKRRERVSPRTVEKDKRSRRNLIAAFVLGRRREKGRGPLFVGRRGLKKVSSCVDSERM